MAVTVEDFIARIALDLHEDPTDFPPGRNELWTLAEIVGYINYAERDFLRRSGITKSDVSVAVAAGNLLVFDKPSGLMDIDRISFNGKRIRRVTSWDLEREDPTWRTHPLGKAHVYHEDHLPINSFELDNRPSGGGTLRIFADTLPDTHTTAGIATETIAVVDTWEQYIRWEVLSLMLAKDGDNQDIARSNYAHQRYLLGCALARRMVTGEGAIDLGMNKDAQGN